LKRFALWVSVGLVLTACQRSPTEGDAPAPPVSTQPTPPAQPAQVAHVGPPLVLARGVRFVKPVSGDVAAVVRTERERAGLDGRTLIVYAGATWCEPCQRFHQAALRGELDDEFPDLTILEFDVDEDRERLVAAGYGSKLIPLFVLPNADGRASGRRFEGGIKGDGAVRKIVPQLKQLVSH
jgi:thiol-disulfide isomerase/thioredoxin